jgi:hypothetical protein
MVSEKAREQRARSQARRQGLRLTKSRVRNPESVEYGTFGLIDPMTNGLVVGESWARGFGYTLDEIETYLSEAN